MSNDESRNNGVVREHSRRGPAPDEQELATKMLHIQSKRIYLDVKQNHRGRFLKIVEITQTTTDGDGQRSHIALPVQGIEEFKSTLAELLTEYGNDANDGSVSPHRLPEGTQIRSERKMLYFDIGQNERGVFMRITEVKRELRNSVTIPESSWHTMSNFFVETCQKMEKLKVQPDKTASVIDSSSSVSKNNDTATADAAIAPPPVKSDSADDRSLGEQTS